jgi:hypothetical protein
MMVIRARAVSGATAVHAMAATVVMVHRAIPALTPIAPMVHHALVSTRFGLRAMSQTHPLYNRPFWPSGRGPPRTCRPTDVPCRSSSPRPGQC